MIPMILAIQCDALYISYEHMLVRYEITELETDILFHRFII
jgi:hypothetical protein